jgi:hypothetical protein
VYNNRQSFGGDTVMRSLWLQLPLVLALALLSWIVGLDTSAGTPAELYFLWAATALAGAFVVMRLLPRASARR